MLVDDDVNPWDANEVEWAIATRMKPDRDVIVIPGVRTDRSEPLEAGGTVAKLAIDATRRQSDRFDWKIARPPAAAIDRARKIMSAVLAPSRTAGGSHKSS